MLKMVRLRNISGKIEVWIFNSPHSLHMGGSWEMMTGQIKGIFNAILLDLNSKKLTHQTLTTFILEVTVFYF